MAGFEAPCISNNCAGLDVPIPTFPSFEICKRAFPLVYKFRGWLESEPIRRSLS